MITPPDVPPDRRRHPSASTVPPLRTALTRRGLLAAVAAAGVVAVGGSIAASRWDTDEPEVVSPAPPAGTAQAAVIAFPADTSATPGAGASDGLALVTSPRLPLVGVGPDDPARLLGGGIADWGVVGAVIALPVEVIALDGAVPTGAKPVAVYADYEALVTGLAARPGGLALVPLDLVDFRVNVLAVGGVDPLRAGRIAGEPIVRLGVVGDVMPGRGVHRKMVQHGDFARPFAKVAALLAGFDLTVANLEGNLSDTLPQPPDTYPAHLSFVTSPRMTEGFALAGIDAVSLANNHTAWNYMGWGARGLFDTIAALDDAGIPHFGAGPDLAAARDPWITERAGTSIAFLGIDGVTANLDHPDFDPAMGVIGAAWGAGDDTPGTSPYATAMVVADVAAAATTADIVLPYFHAGAEYVSGPPAWVRAGARAALEAGATLAVTNHPHVVQGMEVHAGKPIVYSPGNFVFDQMEAWELRTGAIVELVLRGDRVVRVRLHGVVIEDFHQPRLMTAGEQAALMDRFWTNTDRLTARG